jgi:hypothetical protein
MSDGSKSGLIAASDLRTEIDAKKRREEEIFQRSTAEELGIGKKTVFREKGGKVMDVETAREKAIADALAAVKPKVIEVHISNVLAREKERHTSLLAKHCLGTISGFGFDSYVLAVEQLLR